MKRFGLLVVAACVACAADPHSTVNAPSAEYAAQGVLAYMPLKHDTIYEYDVLADSGETGRMVMQVNRRREGRAELVIAGRAQRLSVSPEALALDTGGFLLKAPLEKGASWKGQFGTVTVTSLERKLTTPAGSFEGCLEAVEESLSPPKRATSVYCPTVGLVSLVIEGSVDGEVGSVETTLRYYGPRLELK